jgi:hypothetical protein
MSYFFFSDPGIKCGYKINASDRHLMTTIQKFPDNWNIPGGMTQSP